MSARAGVCVIVPSEGISARLGSTLESLSAQTMAPSDFEVLVVHHGPAPADADLRKAHPRLRLRTITGAASNTAQARNVGLAAVQSPLVTFVSEGDRVSREYLRVLARHDDGRRVVLAQLAEVPAPGHPPDFATAGLTARLPPRPAIAEVTELPHAFGSMDAALLPAEVSRVIGFDPSLRSGEEPVFWAELQARLGFEVRLCPIEEHAVYYRHPRAGRPDFQVDVLQRLDALEALQQIRDQVTTADVRQLVNHQWVDLVDSINGFLRAHPDRHRETVLEIRRRGLSAVPYERLNRGVARDLAVLYAALPFADTSAIVAARRMRKAEVLRDVVCCDMSTQRGTDDSASAIWQEFAGETAVLRTRPVSAWWPAVEDFCRQGLERIEIWETERGDHYGSVYSRAMWPAAHLLAGLYKARNPTTRWLAEYSDPLVHGITGEVRESSGRVDQTLLDELRTAIRANGLQPPDTDNMYVWLEAIGYALADTVLFTNEQQRRYMLGYCGDPDLAARALRHSEVEAHPSLPQEFYQRVWSDYEPDPSAVNIAYFGVFYATRGLTEVTDALRALGPDSRSRLLLHVFTPDTDTLRTQLAELGLAETVLVSPYVSYLEFLNLTTRFDVLLVNDARAAEYHDGLNPYLPSKWSDYAASGSAIWSVVEPGSELSTRPATYRSVLGDVAGAKAVLESIATRAPAHARVPPS